MRALAGLVHELACNVGVTDSGVSPRSLRVDVRDSSHG